MSTFYLMLLDYFGQSSSNCVGSGVYRNFRGTRQIYNYTYLHSNVRLPSKVHHSPFLSTYDEGVHQASSTLMSRVVLIYKEKYYPFLPPTLLSDAPFLETYFCKIWLGSGYI